MQGIDPFLRFCLSKGSITLANGARFIIRGIEGQKLYMEQTDKTTASGGGKTDWYSISATDGVFSMVQSVPNLLVIDSEAAQLDDLRTEYNAIISMDYVASPANQTEMDANLVAYNTLRVSLGISPVS